MDFMQELITAVFCDVDDFCKAFESYCQTHFLPENIDNKGFYPKSSMALSEIMTIVIMFHLSGYRTFKWYYKNHVCKNWRDCFPHLVSYNRFVELMGVSLLPLTVYMMKYRVGKCTGISFIDSTTLDVCDNRRIYSHKVFDGVAKRGKSSTGWFYGFKLHLVINDMGEILTFALTPANVDDRDVSLIERLSKGLFGKLCGDKGYLSAKLWGQLFAKGITLFTKLKKNMKNVLMDLSDKVLLRKRAVIESVNDFLKNICQIEHSRHRSQLNFLVNLVSGLVAYSFLPNKPSLHIDRSDCNALFLE
jgi:hypothetical protein